jgi:hypothetical protein
MYTFGSTTDVGFVRQTNLKTGERRKASSDTSNDRDLVDEHLVEEATFEVGNKSRDRDKPDVRIELTLNPNTRRRQADAAKHHGKSNRALTCSQHGQTPVLF